jgi:hypothetical protein
LGIASGMANPTVVHLSDETWLATQTAPSTTEHLSYLAGLMLR